MVLQAPGPAQGLFKVDVPVFGVYVDGAGTNSTLPAGLQRNRTMAWRWDLIAAAVRQMMGEGKNA